MFPKPSRDKTVASLRESYAERRQTPVPSALQGLQQGFSLLELIVAIAIVLVLAGITAPKVFRTIESQRLQTAARAYATFLQESRYRAEQDGQWYEVLLDQTDPNYTIAYLDINGDGARQASEPTVQIPQPITVPDPANVAVPAGFGNANLLGATPFTVDTTPFTWNKAAQMPGLAFNERGLPCQRAAVTAPCTNTTQINGAGGALVAAPTAWVTYFAYPTATSGVTYAAITVTPAGRIKVWNFQSDGAGGGNWR
jgi:prepilin-type N-terminal cleavage/methylation domain-containing protein